MEDRKVNKDFWRGINNHDRRTQQNLANGMMLRSVLCVFFFSFTRKYVRSTRIEETLRVVELNGRELSSGWVSSTRRKPLLTARTERTVRAAFTCTVGQHKDDGTPSAHWSACGHYQGAGGGGGGGPGGSVIRGPGGGPGGGGGGGGGAAKKGRTRGGTGYG